MKKLAFIMSGDLPMPPINGGAVETLVNSILKSKKVNEKYTIDVYSCKCDGIENNNNNQSVRYLYVDENGILNKIKKIIRFIINKNSKKYIGNLYIANLIKQYSSELSKYDYVVVENRPEYALVLKEYVNGKLIFHAHNDFLSKNKKRLNDIANIYDYFFVVSKYIGKRICEIPGINKEKVKLLYNGINIDKFQTDVNVDEERKKWGLTDTDIVFLYTGRLVKQKGVMELVKAFNSINNEKYKLLIVGSVGYGKTICDKFTRRLNKLSKNNSNIVYTGFIKYDDMYKIYKIANFGIVPSVWEDPCPLVVVEHLASGNPVIITKSGGIPELVNNKCSIIVEKNENLVDNLLKAMELVMKKEFDFKDCIEQASKFNEEQYISNFLDRLEA